MKLNSRQKKFVDAYQGNATEAAKIAGYTGNDNVLGKTGFDLLRNPKVAKAIKEREDKESRKRIATRQQRQEFWTKVMNDSKEIMKNRLKASELLGRSEADFTDKHEHSIDKKLEDLLTESKEEG